MGVMKICVRNEELGTWVEAKVNRPSKEIERSFLWWKWKSQVPAITDVEYCRLAVKIAREMKDANPEKNIKVVWDNGYTDLIWHNGTWHIDTGRHDFNPLHDNF